MPRWKHAFKLPVEGTSAADVEVGQATAVVLEGSPSRLVAKGSADSPASSSDEDVGVKRHGAAAMLPPVVKRPTVSAANDPRLANVLSRSAAQEAAFLEMMGYGVEDEETVYAKEAGPAGGAAVDFTSVVPYTFTLDVKEFLGETTELLASLDDVSKRLLEVQVKVDMVMDREQQIFPGVLSGHTLSTRDAGVGADCRADVSASPCVPAQGQLAHSLLSS
jgi:hypothetical protein